MEETGVAESLTGWVHGRTISLDADAPELEGRRVRVVLELVEEPLSVSETDDDEKERAFQEHLLYTGVLDNIPTGALENDFEPVVVRGRPVSETLIEDRDAR